MQSPILIFNKEEGGDAIIQSKIQEYVRLMCNK